MTGFTAENARFYQDNGYLVLPEVFSRSEVQQMRGAADELLELIINSSLANKRQSRRLNITQRPGGPQIIRRIQPVTDLSLVFSQIGQDPRLTVPVEGVLGGPAGLMEEKITYKQPLPAPVAGLECENIDDRFVVHTDWAYYRDQGYPPSLVSSAIALDDCTPESGPLRVWPGSHREHREHSRTDYGRQVRPGLLDLDAGHDVLIPAGSIVMWHSMIAHSSRANVSGLPRRLMIYSHFLKQPGLYVDARNGPARLQEAPWEWNYQRMKERGEFKDLFKAPRPGEKG